MIKVPYNKLKKLNQVLIMKAGELADVMGFISKKSDRTLVKQGTLYKQSFFIYDDSLVEIECILWGNDTTKYYVEIDMPIIIKNAKVSVY